MYFDSCTEVLAIRLGMQGFESCYQLYEQPGSSDGSLAEIQSIENFVINAMTSELGADVCVEIGFPLCERRHAGWCRQSEELTKGRWLDAMWSQTV